MASYRKPLAAATKIGLKRSSADPCLYYKWQGGRLVIMISWIDDNMIVGPSDLVLKLKSNLMEQFEYDNCGELTEYIGNKIECFGEDAIRLVQTVLTQSYEDELNLGNKCYNMPAQPGMVLMRPGQGKEVLNSEDQTTLRYGVGKLMYQMHYSRPDIAQAVRDLAQYMTCRNSNTLEAMKRCMRFVLCSRNAGLLLKPSWKWDRSKEHQFRIRGKLDSDYAKDTQTRQSVSGYVISWRCTNNAYKRYTEDSSSVVLQSRVERSSTLYARHDLSEEHAGINQTKGWTSYDSGNGQQGRAIDLVNSFSVRGRTRHIDVKQCFLWELKEAKVLVVKWIPGSENEADIFTKNLDGPLFKCYAELLLGEGAISGKGVTLRKGGVWRHIFST
jgi:hypothetical protein